MALLKAEWLNILADLPQEPADDYKNCVRSLQLFKEI